MNISIVFFYISGLLFVNSLAFAGLNGTLRSTTDEPALSTTYLNATSQHQGESMIDLYTWNTPNGRKISIMLEEIGLPYTLKPINIAEGEQKKPSFLALNPNGRIPALFDHETQTRVFESGAMLIYLAEKTGKLLPAKGAQRAEVLSWVFWQMGGLGPMLGQYGHFSHLEQDIAYAKERYFNESLRLLGVMNEALKTRDYLAGDTYSIADISSYPWADAGMALIQRDYPEKLKDMEALRAWLELIAKRSAVQRGLTSLAVMTEKAKLKTS